MASHVRRVHPDSDPTPVAPQRITRSSTSLYAMTSDTPPATSPSENGRVESPEPSLLPPNDPENASGSNLPDETSFDLPSSPQNTVANELTVGRMLSRFDDL